MRRVLVIVLASLTVATVSDLVINDTSKAQGASDAWLMFGKDPQHSGLSNLLGPTTPAALWARGQAFNCSFIQLFSSPVIGSDGVIYAATASCDSFNPRGPDKDSAFLTAVNPDGTLLWQFRIGSAALGTPAIASDGTVYVRSANYDPATAFYSVFLNAVDATGIRWSFALGSLVGLSSQYIVPLLSSPTIGMDGTVYVMSSFLGTSSGIRLLAINLDGTLKWQSGFSLSNPASSPATDRLGTVYVTSSLGQLFAFNPNGTVRFSASLRPNWGFCCGVDGPATIGTSGTIYVAIHTVPPSSTSGASDLFALSPDGLVKWQVRLPGIVVTPPALGIDEHIYVTSGFHDRPADLWNYYLTAISPNGTLEWTNDLGTVFSLRPQLLNPPVVDADSTIYVAMLSGTFMGVTAFRTDGTFKWRLPFGNLGGILFDPTGPLALGGNGTLYAAGQNSALVAIGNAAAPAPTVTSTAPSSGPTIGGTPVTITGTGFVSGASATFGGSAATNVNVVNANTITAVTPTHAAGTVDVVVMNPDGQSSPPLTGGFTYFVPCSYAIEPLNASFEEDGGVGTVAVTAPSGCVWTATSNNADWIEVKEIETAANGSGSVRYSVDATLDPAPRNGSLTIAGHTFTVEQIGLPPVTCQDDFVDPRNPNIAVMFIPNSYLADSDDDHDGRYELKLHRVARQFYCKHADVFQSLTFFSSFPQEGESILDANPPVPASYRPVRTDNIKGLGPMPDGEFNASTYYGSASGVLEGIVNMKSLSQYPPGPRQNDDRFGNSQTTTLDILGHEFAHRWGAYVRFRDSGGMDSDKLLEDPETRPDRTPRHWSFFFDSDASVLFGNNWRHRPRRPWPLNTFEVSAVTEGYSPLDLYLMGLLAPEQVPDFFYIADSPDEPVVGRSALPDIGFGTRGTRIDVSVQDVIDAAGPRVPDVAGAPHVFRQAFVLIVLSGQRPAMADITNDVRRLERLRQAWHTWFREKTNGRGRINSTLR